MKSTLRTRVMAMVLAVLIPLTTLSTFAVDRTNERKNSVSFGEAVEALYALDGEPSMVKQIYNTEEETYATYEKNAELWAHAYNIMSEDKDMNADITQAELAEILYHYAKHHDVDVTANGEMNADDWAISYGIVSASADKEMWKDENVTQNELATALSNYAAADLPKVGVIADGLSLLVPSEGLTTINPLSDFYVIGDIDSSVNVPNNAQLTVQLKNSSGQLVRDVFTTIKDNRQGMNVNYPALTVTSGSRESFRGSMMPDLVYDPNFPESFANTWMKAYYTDEHYTALIYGGAYHDDINPLDQYGRVLEPLPDGDYNLTVALTTGSEVLASLSTQITIGVVPKKVLSRFGPTSYLTRVREYAQEKGYAMYEDPFPGSWILPFFLPEWKLNYIGNIDRRWRLVDRMGYTGGMTYFFNYNTSGTSSSYRVELGQLGYLKRLEDPASITYVYWDIGEPEIKQQGKLYMGKFVEKSVSQVDPIIYTRADHSTIVTPENTIDPEILNETSSVFDLSQQFDVPVGETVSLNGLCKVIQPDHMTLNQDETFTFGNKIASIRYTLTFASGEVYQVVQKDVSLKRTFDDGSTSTSILEFRHNFTVNEDMRGNVVRVFAQAVDEFGNNVGGQLYACAFRVPRS